MPEEESPYKQNMQAGGEFRKGWEHKELGSWYNPGKTKAKVMGGILLFLTAMVGLKNCDNYKNNTTSVEGDTASNSGLEKSLLEEFRYDELGRVIFSKRNYSDGLVIESTKVYNNDGSYTRRVREYVHDKQKDSDLLITTTETKYDANNNPLQKKVELNWTEH